MANRTALLALAFLAFASFATALTKEEWKSRSIYQLLTDRFAKSEQTTQGCGNLGWYCGGTWQGITNNLDYIQGMGFDAIWITPVVANIDGGYHGYWLSDLYAVNENFGSNQDLKNMVAACHSRGIAVMLDVVGNHVGPVDMDFGRINPFNQASHYHSVCQITDWNNQQQVEVCRLANLPDLDQSNSFVFDTLTKWAGDIVQEYGFDALRIDTIPEVSASFWPSFAKSSGVFTIGEVFNGNPSYVANYQHYIDSVLHYPMYFTLRNCFQSQNSLKNMESAIQQYNSGLFVDASVLGLFIDNHDNARFLNGKNDLQLYKNAITYVLTGQGIPIIYYGTEQQYAGGNDPQNRETLWTDMVANSTMYSFIRQVNQLRKSSGYFAQAQVQRYADDQFYAFTRGTTFVALTNVGQYGQQVQRTITYHPYTAGTVLCNLFASNDCVTVQSNQFTVSLINGEPKIYTVHTSQEVIEI